jgi:hypothetical protein
MHGLHTKGKKRHSVCVKGGLNSLHQGTILNESELVMKSMKPYDFTQGND